MHLGCRHTHPMFPRDVSLCAVTAAMQAVLSIWATLSTMSTRSYCSTIHPFATTTLPEFLLRFAAFLDSCCSGMMCGYLLKGVLTALRQLL